MLHLLKSALEGCGFFMAVKNASWIAQLFSILLGYVELENIVYLENSTDLLHMFSILQLQPLNFQKTELFISFPFIRNKIKCIILE